MKKCPFPLCIEPVAGSEWRYELVPDLPLRDDIPSAQCHQIVHIGRLVRSRPHGGGLLEAGKSSSLEKLIECRKHPPATVRRPVGVDLLKAQDVGVDLQKLFPKMVYSQRKKIAVMDGGPKIFEIERRNPASGRH
jgi:hypothetical protein